MGQNSVIFYAKMCFVVKCVLYIYTAKWKMAL